MNSFYLIGKVQNEPERFEGNNGLKYAKFRVSVDKVNKDNAEPDIFEVVVFKAMADVELQKGQIVAVNGRLQANNYPKEEATKFNANLIANNINVVA